MNIEEPENLIGRKTGASRKWVIGSVAIVLAVTVGQTLLSHVNVNPFQLDGGIIWAKNGVHYLNKAEVDARITSFEAPKEAILSKEIAADTPSCESVDTGYCQMPPGTYVIKSVATPAVISQPGTPDTKKIIGYCTLCNDGSYSPSCAVGRGACSWHGGVQAYDAPEYITIPGTPAVPAQPATYSYSLKSYKDSPQYTQSDAPTLSEIIRQK